MEENEKNPNKALTNSPPVPSHRSSTSSSSSLSPLSDRSPNPNIKSHQNNNIDKPSLNHESQSHGRKSSATGSELSYVSSIGHGSPPPEKFQPPSPDLLPVSAPVAVGPNLSYRSPNLKIESHQEINNPNISINNKPSINPQSQSQARKSSPARSSTASELSSLSSLGHGSPPPEKFQPLSQDVPPVNAPSVAEVRRGDQGGGGRRVRQSLSILRTAKREEMVKRSALGFRICGAVFCLISLSVMAADKEKGWALDSFYRYKEFRYCISVNLVGFLYSVAQICDLVFTMCTGKYTLRHRYRFYFDFAMDQILTYLLMSASSSAATRVDDWESNWGKDPFPTMANVSVGLSFMSFVSLAASTLISGYALCTWSSYA